MKTKIKRGFPVITIKNFPEDLKIPLFKIYAKEHLDSASASFMEGVTEKNLEKRVYKMILNAIIVEAIKDGLDREGKKRGSKNIPKSKKPAGTAIQARPTKSRR